MNEDRVRQVLEIEKQAAALYDAAVGEADRLPSAAEKEAREEHDRILAAARTEAGRMLESAQAQEESAQILARAEEEIRRMEDAARKNHDRTAAFIVDAVSGKGTE
jgi:vacuolar-type H+-ATPase subunit H